MKPTTIISLVLLLSLVGCASTTKAPVEDSRTTNIEKPVTTTPVTAAPVAAAPSGPTYTVKKGDGLISIALNHGLDYKDIAMWNGIENPNLILVDQVLRLSPPESAAPSAVFVKPIAAPPNLEVKPVKPIEASQASAASMNTDNYKREPKGGKHPYSPEALERLHRAEGIKPSETVASAATPVTVPPTESPPVVPTAPVAPTTVANTNLIDWSWPLAGTVLAPFNESSNKGIDIAGKLGEPIGAAAAGKVVYAGSGLRGYGKLVIVRHSADYLSAYAHAKEIMVKEGQTVTRLQKIAEVGDSDADRVKLHFEVRYRGVPVDPQKHLPAH